MVDVFDQAKRSWVMSRVKGKNTKPERVVRSLFHRLGYRFTVNGPKNRKLPGKPDMVLPKIKTVVFVHGCFWHGHPGCRDHRVPKTRSEWWSAKIRGNQLRDRRNQKALEALGWNVVVIWACEIDNPYKLAGLASELSTLLNSGMAPPRKVAETHAEAAHFRYGKPPAKRKGY